MDNNVSDNKTINCSAIIYELLGTTFLAMNLSAAGVWAKQNNGPLHMDALVAFFTLWYLVILTGRVSAAQFNSALTVVWMFRSAKGHFTRLRYGMPYLICEIIGAFLGAFMVWWVKGEVSSPSIPTQSTIAQACVYEILGSFVLITMILMVSDPVTKVSDIHAVNGIAIAIGLIVAIILTQGVSGAGINPSVVIGLSMVEYMRTGDSDKISDLWVYIIFPIIGAFLALLFHEFSAKPTLKIITANETLRSKYSSSNNQSLQLRKIAE